MIDRFADAFYFIALFNPRDEYHERAVELSRVPGVRTWTTPWILTEVGDAFASTRHRHEFLPLVQHLRADPLVILLSADDDLFDRGLDLYARRPDKAWSLTDCISFVTMEERGIAEALTGDRHFEQAGFKALLT